MNPPPPRPEGGEDGVEQLLHKSILRCARVFLNPASVFFLRASRHPPGRDAA